MCLCQKTKTKNVMCLCYLRLLNMEQNQTILQNTLRFGKGKPSFFYNFIRLENTSEIQKIEILFSPTNDCKNWTTLNEIRNDY
jgi:hypothetical protein